MSSDPTPSPIPVGDLRLYDSYLPALGAGSWYLEADHALLDGSAVVNADALTAKQELVVTAPQLSLPQDEILALHPPPGSTGQFADELPHVVLSEPMLPWERSLAGDVAGRPWLALLVLDADQVVDPAGSATGAIATTVDAFLATADGSVLKPSVTREHDVAGSDPMTMVVVPTTAFAAVMPRLDELEYLAHCRQASTADKATLAEQGLFSVVVANRFPAAPAAAGDPPARCLVHLVSVEGLEPYLVESPDFGSATSVALASLASWSFWTIPDPREDFRGLMEAIVQAGSDHGSPAPDAYRLRLRSDSIDGAAPGGGEAIARLRQGYVPLTYATRTGESTLGWYRGPLAPYPVARLDRSTPLPTADAALAYQPAYGVFDASLAAAFHVGRAAALADPAFGQRLLDLRTRGHRFADALHHRLTSDAFSATEIAALSGANVQDELRGVLTADLLADLGKPGLLPVPPAPPPPGPDSSPQEALAAFLAEDDVQQALLDAVGVDLDPVATWLGQLLLLGPVPFHALVPRESMLPRESLRFFHLDPNWLAALLDGALSIGIESSRDTFFHQIAGDVLHAAAYDAVAEYRSTIAGTGPPSPATGTGPMSGMLLRSGVVSGWPNLAVRPEDHDGALLATLRMERLSPDVLLCLFTGTPAKVTVAEPQEGFRFGVDQDGCATLRSLAATASLQVGEQFPGDPVVLVRDPQGTLPGAMRPGGARVLNVAPGAEGGLVAQLAAGVAKAAQTAVATFGSADLALQMLNAPEAVAFTAPTGG
ncbi:hypothetical protein PAI11_38250 [Patulibacter medicamentivorans]|uniref:Uncharacterized protein n=1 Tax=Patulibacter medicamentivorans TaxID=1097667 RepID=H0EAF1_9ACTN|nr:hypothetical protein [Patulibacter medicamentivorans]EHN09278.1 hypothetical protein PAI11_38250 [Patulibacter medicamentivorans]